MFPLDPIIINMLMPPCIGAFIGYLTNRIAIAMLFRPLRPWHVFGIRVPMTPGVIPGKREALADNIGIMVGRHLLTSQDIGGAVSAEPFQEHLRQLVERNGNEILRRDLGPLGEIVPKGFQAYFQIGVKTLKYRLAVMVNNYIASPDFAQKLEDAVDSRMNDALHMPTEALLDTKARAIFCAGVYDMGRELLMDKQNEERLARFLSAGLRKAADEGRTVADLLPDEILSPVRQLILDQSSVLLHKLGRHLTDPEMRKQMVKGILSGLDHFLDSMGAVGAMARGFLEPATLEGKISDYLESREDDLLVWMGQPAMQSRILLIIDEYIENILQTDLHDLLERIGEDEFERFCASCANRVLSIVRADEIVELLRQAIAGLVEEITEQGNAPLKSVIARLLPGGNEMLLQQLFKGEMLRLFRSPSTERLVHGMVASLVDRFLARPFGRLYDMVPHGVREGGVTFIIMTINRILLQEVPGVVKSLNLERVVTEKVNKLDLLQLEELLLSIMKEQFKYINIFGALLGFVIGSVNVIIARLL